MYFVVSDMYNFDVRLLFLVEVYKIICRDFGKECVN